MKPNIYIGLAIIAAYTAGTGMQFIQPGNPTG